jgi:hypothetical protein
MCDSGECRKCRQRKASREWHGRNRERCRALEREWRLAHPDHKAEINRRRDPVKVAAAMRVSTAIRNGSLVKESCEECGGEAHAHHDDYSKPLEVRWLCPEHHMGMHRGLA